MGLNGKYNFKLVECGKYDLRYIKGGKIKGMQISNDGVEPIIFNYVVDSADRAPVYKHLGINIIRLGKGICELEMLVTQEHCIAEGQIQGGMLMTLGDAAMGLAMQSLGIDGATVEMTSQFIYSVRTGQSVQAWADVVKAGKRVLFIKAEISDKDKVLFRCHGVFINKGPIKIP